MTEAILIEIARRFRQMEDAVEAVDLHAAAEEERLNARGFTAGEAETIGAARHQLTEAVEACREDMVAMQEALRKCGGVK